MYSRSKAPSRFAIPTAMRIKGSKKTGETESLIVFNHLRFVVSTVVIDPAPKVKGHSQDEGKAQRIAISHLEVIPMR